MLCPSCGELLSSESRFCNFCGTELNSPDETSASILPVSVFVPSDTSGFVGRRREMGELVSALRDALSGRGRLVMLVGEPGIGKTRTAHEIASLADFEGAEVLWGHCYEGEGAPPYWPWLQTLRAYIQRGEADNLRSLMGAGAVDIAELVPELRDKLPDLNPPPALEPEAARFRLFDSITTFLKDASHKQPIVLVLDDLHWADSSSLLLLEFVAHEIADSRLLLMGTYRDVDVTRRHPLSRSLGTLVRGQLFQSIELKGLNQQEVGQLAEATIGESLERNLLEAVHGRTEGNPLFVGEVVRMLERERGDDGLGWDIRIPSGIRDVIGRRLDGLSEECNRVLTVASVIGREFDFRPLKALTDFTSEDELLEVLDEALEASIIEEVPGGTERYQFSHALIRQTLTEELSISRRVRLHATIGEILEKIYGSELEIRAAELAYHFGEAQTLVGTEKLVHYSFAAGQYTLATYAYEEALTHFERALAVKQDQPMDSETAALVFALGRAHMATQQPIEARADFNRAFDYYAEERDVAEVTSIVRSLPPGGGLLGMTQLTARALDLVPSDSLHAARFLSRHGIDLGRTEGNYEDAQEAFLRALTIARRENDSALEMRTLANAADVDFYHLHIQEAAERSSKVVELAQYADDPYSEALARLRATMVLMRTGDSKAAGQHAAAGLAICERLRDRYRLRNALLTCQGLASLKGDREAAREFSDRALALGAHVVARDDASLLAARALLEYDRGDFVQGEAHLDQLLEVIRLFKPGPTMEGITSAISIVLIARSTDGGSKGVDTAEASVRTVLASPNVTPLQAEGARATLALIAVQEGDVTAAAEQHSALKSHRGVMLPYFTLCVDRLLGLLAHTMGNLEDSKDHFEDGLVFCREAGYRPELAWTCHDYAEALLQGNASTNREEVASLLEEALSISTELGMKPLMGRVLALQEKAGARRRSPAYPDGLTEREVEVLRLIASGKSNHEIAVELFISQHTVVRHVSNLFAKTGVANRAEAATYANQQGLVGDTTR